MNLLLIILLILLFVGPFGAYNAGLGYGPSGGIGLVLLIILIVYLLRGRGI